MSEGRTTSLTWGSHPSSGSVGSARRRLRRRAKRGKPYAWTLPLSPYRYAFFTTPSRLMTDAEWDQMMVALEAMKPGLVKAADDALTKDTAGDV